MLLGAQLYTVRQFTQSEKDFERSMKKIAEIGYTTVQISAVGNIAPEKIREICDKYNLKIVLTHTNPDRILNDTAAVIKEHDILGCKYIGIGSMPERYRYSSWIANFVADYKAPAQKLAEAGKLLMYHNHQFEFAKIDGKYIIDMLIDGFSKDELGFTLDTYWVQYAGEDVCRIIDRLNGRLPCIHLKDMQASLVNAKCEMVMAPVLEGNLNFKPMIEAFDKAGTEFMLVEQDTCLQDPFECLAKSYNNLAKLGYR